MKRLIFSLFILLQAFGLHAELQAVKAQSRIANVILYRSQALVSRDVTVPELPGEYALELESLPASVLPGTLFASSKDLDIISVRLSAEYLPIELPKNRFAQIEEKIKQTEEELHALQIGKSKLSVNIEFLKLLQGQYIAKLGPSATALTEKEVQVGGFDFKTIPEMTEFLFKKRNEFASETNALESRERSLNQELEMQKEKLTALRHEFGIREEANASTQQAAPDMRKTVHKAIIYVSKQKPGKSQLSAGYLVLNASWSPAYNVRISGAGKEFSLEYIAHVRQTTGEDWNSISLTLSTATPSANAEIPILAPMWVNLAENSGAEEQTQSVIDVNPIAKTLSVQKANVTKFKLKKDAQGELADNISLNYNANEVQCIEFQNKKENLRRWYDDVKKTSTQIAVEYAIKGSLTLSSRNDEQMATILTAKIPCSLYYEAVPLLAGFVSRGIEATNIIEQPLLAGSYSAFADGQYVGTGTIGMTAKGQQFVIGFGIDPQLRCERELLDKNANKSWGDRTETYKYRLSIDNYKTEAVAIRLMDRIPVTKDKGLKILIEQGADKLCKDPEYMEFDYPKGILRWDVSVPPSSFGASAFKFDYSFKMEFDSDMRISSQGQAVQEQIKDDISNFERRRSKK